VGVATDCQRAPCGRKLRESARGENRGIWYRAFHSGSRGVIGLLWLGLGIFTIGPFLYLGAGAFVVTALTGQFTSPLLEVLLLIIQGFLGLRVGSLSLATIPSNPYPLRLVILAAGVAGGHLLAAPLQPSQAFPVLWANILAVAGCALLTISQMAVAQRQRS
jgi:hypothetical protein